MLDPKQRFRTLALLMTDQLQKARPRGVKSGGPNGGVKPQCGGKAESSHQRALAGKQKRAPSSREVNKGTGHFGHSPNPMRQHGWGGWERYTCFEACDSPLLTDPCVHDAMVRHLSGRDLSHACVWLSLAAQMRSKRFELVLASMAKRQWAEVPGEKLHSVLSEWCRKANARWVLYGVTSGGAECCSLEQLCSAAPAGAATRDSWHFLQVQSDVGFHLMPLEQPADVIVPRDILCPAQPEPARDPPGPEPAAPGQVPEAGELVAAQPDQPREPCNAVEVQPVPKPVPMREPGQYHDETLRYEGMFPPPPDADAYDGYDKWSDSGLNVGKPVAFSWMAGWLSSEGIDARPSFWRRRPVLVSATLDMFALYGGTVLYYLPKVHRFTAVGRRGLTDGVGSFTFFTAGDSLTRAREDWVAVETHVCGIDLLKVVRRSDEGILDAIVEHISDALSCPKPLRSLLDLSPPPVTVRAPCNTQLPVFVTDKMSYDVARMTMPENAQPLIQRAWVEWQSSQGGEGAPKAEVAANYATKLLEHSAKQPFSYSGGRPFEWGYCYSCGAQLPGKRMPGRLCGCAQTPAARVYADGGRIARLGGVTYPGVVTTTSRHPPLKSGKKTLANSQVFREPPSVVRR